VPESSQKVDQALIDDFALASAAMLPAQIDIDSP